jgi:hypothetical protein
MWAAGYSTLTKSELFRIYNVSFEKKAGAWERSGRDLEGRRRKIQ